MVNKTHVRFVNTHAKSDRSHDHTDAVFSPVSVHSGSCVVLHPGVIAASGKTKVAKALGS